VSEACYVWYRVAADVDAAASAIAAMQADVERRTGVAGRLLARVDDPSTWMEVYEDVEDSGRFAAALAQCAERHDVARITGSSERHVERFAPFARR
jgi:hypothetical protein